MREIKVPLYKQYQKFTTSLQEDPGSQRKMRQDLSIYRGLLIELVSEIEAADNWIKTGGPDFIAMESLMKKVREVKSKMPGEYK